MKNSISLIFAMCFIATLTSCSSFVESTRKMIDGDSPRKSTKQSGWVSKSQYDDLMVKYKDLSQRYENLKEKKSAPNASYDQAQEMSSSSVNSEETVDVFGEDGLANQVSASLDEVSSKVKSKPLSSSEIDQEVKTYKKAALLKDNGKVDESLKVFQFLEKSQTKQIRVRSKIHIGQIYLVKKQFDLALQVFESVINQEAFSARVLDALEGAVISSSSLGLTDKKLRYESMLKDVFGLKG
jgi:tetratricopeptide (TPR) repeat protein